jgi:hypothetical protein
MNVEVHTIEVCPLNKLQPDVLAVRIVRRLDRTSLRILNGICIEVAHLKEFDQSQRDGLGWHDHTCRDAIIFIIVIHEFLNHYFMVYMYFESWIACVYEHILR